jgi:hypothetical protein
MRDHLHYRFVLLLSDHVAIQKTAQAAQAYESAAGCALSLHHLSKRQRSALSSPLFFV